MGRSGRHEGSRRSLGAFPGILASRLGMETPRRSFDADEDRSLPVKRPAARARPALLTRGPRRPVQTPAHAVALDVDRERPGAPRADRAIAESGAFEPRETDFEATPLAHAPSGSASVFQRTLTTCTGRPQPSHRSRRGRGLRSHLGLRLEPVTLPFQPHRLSLARRTCRLVGRLDLGHPRCQSAAFHRRFPSRILIASSNCRTRSSSSPSSRLRQ